jgi:hypothetical protein
LVILKAETLKQWAVTASCGWERKFAGTPGRRSCLRWLAEWDSEIAVVVEEKERNLWAEMPTNSSPPEMSTRLTRLVVDKTSRRTRASQCSHAPIARVWEVWWSTQDKNWTESSPLEVGEIVKRGRGADAKQKTV